MNCPTHNAVKEDAVVLCCATAFRHLHWPKVVDAHICESSYVWHNSLHCQVDHFLLPRLSLDAATDYTLRDDLPAGRIGMSNPVLLPERREHVISTSILQHWDQLVEVAVLLDRSSISQNSNLFSGNLSCWEKQMMAPSALSRSPGVRVNIFPFASRHEGGHFLGLHCHG